MTTYDVSFFNHLVNDQGQCRKVLQRCVRVASACDPEDAVCQAKRRFAELERIEEWRHRASDIDVAIVR